MSTFALAACGGGGGFAGSGGNASSGKQTVTMLVNVTPNLSETYWRNLVAPYEKANNVTVKIQAPSGSGVSDTLPQLLAAGTAPDIVETLMANKTLAPQMLDLTDQSWVNDTPLVKEASLGGKVYTVGVGEQAQSLVYYNEDAFTKAGIAAPPKDLDEFTTDLGKLKAAGYLPLQTGGDYITGLQLLQLADPSIVAGDASWYQDVKAGKADVGQSLQPLLQRYQDWLKAGYLDKNALGLKADAAQTNFLSGKAGMYIMGSWLVSTVASTKTSFPVGAFAAPGAPGGPYPGAQGATMAAPYMVLKSSQHRDAAVALVKWLVTDHTAVTSQLKQDGDFRPGFDWCTIDLCKQVQQILTDAPATTPQGEGYGDLTLPAGFNTEFNKDAQGLYVGRSPAQVAQAVDAWVKSNS
ncbi:ABC transporter substrate-binding protein [Rugosimonospora acidiphila]|uniref:ABC transporter substrate-binding protein n=1 Tax=Rugosimonospora acidiphila TaxID=556531 RepID=A0ABP9S1Q9_9ACTN